ncbi:hypothetical protein TNCV_2468671 [Trichonephila clavipes]|nr:hypothetical protein TNCV_2468671 [Trichonephila clavipes]
MSLRKTASQNTEQILENSSRGMDFHAQKMYGGGDRWCCPIGNFAELNHTVTCMVLKANDRCTSSPTPQ